MDNEKYDGQYEIKLEEVVEASYNDKMSTLAQSGKLPVLISGGSTKWINTVLIPQKLYYDTKAGVMLVYLSSGLATAG